MQDGDSAMPCILEDQPCPCWRTDEVLEVDGIMWDGYDTPFLRRFDASNDPYNSALLILEERDSSFEDYLRLMFFRNQWNLNPTCVYSRHAPPGHIARALSLQAAH